MNKRSEFIFKKVKLKIFIIAFLWPFITTSFVVLFYLPEITHCMDRELLEVNCNELPLFKNHKTSNLSINGVLYEHAIVSLETTNLMNRHSEYSNFVPIVCRSFNNHDSIYCIMKIDGSDLNNLLELQSSSRSIKMNVIARTLFWEAMDDNILDNFKKTYKVSDNFLFVEYGTQSKFPFWLALGVFLISIFGSFGIVKSSETHIKKQDKTV